MVLEPPYSFQSSISLKLCSPAKVKTLVVTIYLKFMSDSWNEQMAGINSFKCEKLQLIHDELLLDYMVLLRLSWLDIYWNYIFVWNSYSLKWLIYF